MAYQQIFGMKYVSCGIALLLLNACLSPVDDGRVDLEPNDPRAILSLDVADADEATLLVQEINLDVVRMEGLTVYFFEDADQLPRLVDLGYDIEQQNPYEVFRRVVRIDRSIPEDELVASGLQIINREEEYLIVEAAIGNLRALVRTGAQIESISGHEPRPRNVQIVVQSMGDVAKIGAMHVDIYSVEPQHKDPIDSQQIDRDVSIVIYGGAFDYQIDRLREADYSVEILP